MSLYELAPRKAFYRVRVGWEHTKGSFVAQVEDTLLDALSPDSEPRLWLGAAPPWVRDFYTLRQAVEPYAEIPDSVEAKLISDRAASEAVPRTYDQESALRLVERCCADPAWPRRQSGT